MKMTKRLFRREADREPLPAVGTIAYVAARGVLGLSARETANVAFSAASEAVACVLCGQKLRSVDILERKRPDGSISRGHTDADWWPLGCAIDARVPAGLAPAFVGAHVDATIGR